MTVFVIQENDKFDYGPAEIYGDVVFVTANQFKPYVNSVINTHIVFDIERAMLAFDPDKDWLLLTGSPISIGYAFHLAMQKAGRVKCLQWDKMANVYKEIIFDPKRIKNHG